MSGRLSLIVPVALALASTPAVAQIRVDKRADVTVPIVLGANQAAIVVGFRRTDAMSEGKSATLNFVRYDPEKRDMIPQPAGARKSGDTTTYWIEVRSGLKTLTTDYALMIVSAGDYALHSGFPGRDPRLTTTFCLGAPMFHVKAGEVVYFGDVTPYVTVKLVDGRSGAALAYSSHVEDARRALSGQPALAAVLQSAALYNRATFSCSAMIMNAYFVPEVGDLPDPGAALATPVQPSH